MRIRVSMYNSATTDAVHGTVTAEMTACTARPTSAPLIVAGGGAIPMTREPISDAITYASAVMPRSRPREPELSCADRRNAWRAVDFSITATGVASTNVASSTNPGMMKARNPRKVRTATVTATATRISQRPRSRLSAAAVVAGRPIASSAAKAVARPETAIVVAKPMTAPTASG